jgi:predicted lipid-binding transport protein (Tim44 family)
VPPYDPEVIEQFAAQLERRAVSVKRGFTIFGAALGAVFGSVPLTPLHVAWPVPQVFGFATLLGGIGIGALIGWVVGEGRAALHRLHAQTTLCQLHAQRTSLAIWRLLEQKRAEAPAPVPTPEPVAAAPTPAPVAPAPVAPAPAPAPVLEPVPVSAPVTQVVPVAPLAAPAPEPVPVAAQAPREAAVRLAAAPPALRQAGPVTPPLQPPPLTG